MILIIKGNILILLTNSIYPDISPFAPINQPNNHTEGACAPAHKAHLNWLKIGENHHRSTRGAPVNQQTTPTDILPYKGSIASGSGSLRLIREQGAVGLYYC